MSGEQQAPGWYPDPWGTDDERYFDGAAWTRSVRPPGSTTPIEHAVDRRGEPTAIAPPVAEPVPTPSPPRGAATAPIAATTPPTSQTTPTAAQPSSTQTPAGWFPDPWRVAQLRYWDGTQWTGYTSGASVASRPSANDAPIEVQMHSERSTARLARTSLLWAGPLQAIAVVAGALQIQWLADHWDSVWNAARTSGATIPSYDNAAVRVLGQVAALGLLVAGVMFLLWFYRAAAISSASGIPARRRPVWAVVSFLIPIINWWFPYQSACDLFPEGHPARRLVLRWWLLWITIAIGSILMFAVAFVSKPLLVAVGVITAGAAIPAAFAARDVVAEVLALHESLTARPAAG